MKEIRLGKVVVNIGLKESGEPVERAFVFVEKLTGKKPIKRFRHKGANLQIRKAFDRRQSHAQERDAFQFLKKVFRQLRTKSENHLLIMKETSVSDKGTS